MDDHLGYEKHDRSDTSNSINGFSSKTARTEDGTFKLSTPRDREGSIEPKLVKKHQTRFISMEDKRLSLYANGMTTREIVDSFEEWYGTEISPALVYKITNAVLEQVIEWQSRPLDPIYPIVYLDCIVNKIRQDKVINKSIFLALGVILDGHKELLGMWITENESAKFWLNVLRNYRIEAFKTF
jgi:transposase-like protein